jgi:indolepyruvate ferredoxin oxidoreductase beta subunit
VTIVTNIVFAGLGGQGVLTASDILADAAFVAGYDVKKSEVHGMAQRGGSVISDLRYGLHVYSPMVSLGEADYVVVLDITQLDYASAWIKPNGVVISPQLIDEGTLPNKRSMNVALLGLLAPYLSLSLQAIEDAITSHLKPELHDDSLQLFRRMTDKTRSLS